MSCILNLAGKTYDWWTEIEIQRGIEQLSGRFNLTLMESFQSRQDSSIFPGRSCAIALDDVTVMTGWLDAVTSGVDKTNRWLSVSGRDKTADLIDCSAIHKTGQWKNRSLEQIAADLLAPFRIDLVIGQQAKAVAAERFGSWSIEPGETVFACIERACRQRAVMLWGDPLGRVVIDLPGSDRAKAVLEDGVNIKYCEARWNHAERFSNYTVKAQTKDSEDGEAGHASHGESTDSAIARHRPLVVIAETHLTTTKARARAKWEASVRAGRGNRATIKVAGWRQFGESGDLWMPGQRVGVKSETLRIDGDLLIANCTWRYSGNDGKTTELDVVDPRAFDLISGVRASKLKRKSTGKNGLAVESGAAAKGKKEKDWSML